MLIYDRLKQEHQTFKKMIGQLKETKDGDANARESTFAEMKQNIEAHTLFENEVFYPAVKRNTDARKLIEEAIEEHDRVSSMLEDLDESPKGSPDWLPKLKELEKMLVHHIREEESEIFKLGQAVIDAKRAEEMTREYDEAKHVVKKRA